MNDLIVLMNEFTHREAANVYATINIRIIANRG